MCVVREINPKRKSRALLSHCYGGNIEMRGRENEHVRQTEEQTELEESVALMALSPRCR